MLSTEDKIMLACIKLHPTEDELLCLNSLIQSVVDWDYCINMIIDRGIAPLLFDKLPLLSAKKHIPAEVQVKLQQAYYKTLSRSMLLYDAFKKVATALNDNGVQVIALKGVYLSEWLYHDIGLRQFSDLDLLVLEEDGLKSQAILATLGYRAVESQALSEFVAAKSDFVHYAPMYLNDVSVELHIRLHKKSEDYDLDRVEVWRNAGKQTLNSVPVKVLDLYDLFIHICVHLDKHFKVGQVQFTSFNDVVNILSEKAAIFDWELLIERCVRYKCENLIFKYVTLVNKYCGVFLPDSILSEYKELLTPAFETRFIDYLQGKTFEVHSKSAVPAHLSNLKLLNSFADYLRYFNDLLFPSKTFMMDKYVNQLIVGYKELSSMKLDLTSKNHPNRKLLIVYSRLLLNFWWIWYPYRWAMGLKGLVQLIIRKR